MKIEEFNEKLDIAGLRKKEFAQITGLSYGSITNWGQVDKPIPSWVDSWLNLYIENKVVKQIANQIRESGICKDK